MPKVQSFAIGTTVEIKNNQRKGIITAVSVSDNDIEYAVDACAWFDSNALRFISDPTDVTLSAVFEMMQEAYEEYEDEEFED